MQPSVTFNTQNTNWYLYSTFKSEFIYIHPILAFIINNESALFSLETDVERATILKKLGEYSFEDINYYLSKFEFLKNNNYFKINQRITQPITSEIIKDGISKCEAITFEVTENCNLNCKYCGYGEYYENYEIRTNPNIDLTNSFALIDLLFE